MPCIGNVCPRDGTRCNYDFCIYACKERCLPLPLILTLARRRIVVPGVYSTTEILAPPKVVWLNRNTDFYVNPMSQTYAALGTSFHSIMEEGAAEAKELGAGDQFIVEQPFRIEFDTPVGHATLTGRPDLYDTTDKTLYDWKTVKGYSVKKAREGDWGTYLMQVNIYRVYGFPEAERQKLVFMVKDHDRKMRLRDGLEPVEVVDVPLLFASDVKRVVFDLLTLHLNVQRDPQTYLRDCTDEEVWRTDKTGEPRRCQDFCPQGQDRCVQWLTEQKEKEK